MKNSTKGTLLTTTSALLFGFTPILAKMTYSLGSNAATLTFYRNFMIIPILVLYMIILKIDFSLKKKNYWHYW